MNHFAKIAEKLSAYELDGMLLTCEANRFYASGFHSTGTDGVALVTREGNFYFTDSRYIEAAHNKVQDAEIAMTDAAHPYVDLINAAMEKTHVQKLGFEDAYMTVADYRHYSEKLHCQLVPATELLISLRQSKDEEEIQRMIAAQRIAEAALDQIVKEIRPGVTEKEIAARLQYLMLAGGAENMSFDPIVASGPNGSMPHAVPTDRKIQDGDFVTMDFGCIYQGYCSDMTRTVAVGRVTEEMEKVYNVVLQAQLAGIAAAKAGKHIFTEKVLALTNEDAFVKRLVRRASLMHNKDVDPQMAYMISKNFARWYAAGCAFKYMRRRGIRVLSVSPGYVETPMTEKEKGKATDILLSYSGPGRGAKPEELAFLIVSIADERCGYLMGTDVLCDAGCVNAGYGLTVATNEKKHPSADGLW